MISDFKLNTTVNNDHAVIETFGYINNVGGEAIVTEFNKHKDSGVNNFILNLAETKVVNSIGISFLIEMIEKLNDSGGKLIFTNLDPTIDKTFTIMGLFQFTEKAANVEEAVSKL